MSVPAWLFALFLLAVFAALLIGLPATSFSFHGGNLTCAFVEIHLRNGTCEPGTVYVYKNATVVWVNDGPGEHAICVEGDISDPLMPGESFSKNFHEIGDFEFYCRYHPEERGRVVVR